MSHNDKPMKISEKVVRDKSLVLLECMTFINWGMYAIVVQKAAAKPTIVTSSMEEERKFDYKCYLVSERTSSPEEED